MVVQQSQDVVSCTACDWREGDVPLEVQTLTYAAVVSGMHLHWQESVDDGLRAIELATGDENPFSEVFSRYWTAQGLPFMGDLDAARHHALVLRDLVERRCTPRSLASRGFVPVTWLSCLEGDWTAGREYSDRGLELAPLNPQLLLPRVLLEHETEESAQGEVYLEQLLQAMRRAGPDQLLAATRASTTITAIARITGVPEVGNSRGSRPGGSLRTVCYPQFRPVRQGRLGPAGRAGGRPVCGEGAL